MLSTGGLPMGAGKITREQIIEGLGYEPVKPSELEQAVACENFARNTSFEWSEWIMPVLDASNRQVIAAKAYLPKLKNAGDEYTCSIEIEFNGVKAGTDGNFSFSTQGAVDNAWVMQNVWYQSLVNLKTPPNDGIYKYVTTSALNANAVNATIFDCAFRCDYWGAGKFRYRCVKVEKGTNPTPFWTPSPYDYQKDILTSLDDLAARVKALEDKLVV